MSIKIGAKVSPYIELMLRKYPKMRDHIPTYFEVENDKKLQKAEPEAYEIEVARRSEFMEHFRRMIEFVKGKRN